MDYNPRGQDNREPHKAEDHPQRMLVVRSEDDVVHVPLKPSQDHHHRCIPFSIPILELTLQTTM